MIMKVLHEGNYYEIDAKLGNALWYDGIRRHGDPANRYFLLSDLTRYRCRNINGEYFLVVRFTNYIIINDLGYLLCDS